MKENRAREQIEAYQGPPVRIMEVCGTHTHEIFKLGIRNLLPGTVTLISGPGCPVCVTPCGFLDEAVWLAKEKGATLCTFGDLVRVPGSRTSLAQIRSEGARVKIVYSPMDAVEYAKEHPGEEVVFLSVGFETTTPASCLAVRLAKESGVKNFSLLTANKTMPKAYEALKGSVDVFLYPGHVNAIAGTKVCEELVKEGVSGVVAGFQAEELLRAFAVALLGFSKGQPFFANCYPEVVSREGNAGAKELVEQLMAPCSSEWRGIGWIPDSGLVLRPEWEDFDARKRFGMPEITGESHPACRCGEVLQGKCRPVDCPLFGKACAPLHPVGACMVSSEGACSAYYQYGGFQA